MNLADYPEPTDPKDINRKRGSTEFERCGWCPHNTTGTARYNYIIEGHCHLLADAEYSYDYKKDIHRVHWDTPCKVKSLSKSQLHVLLSRFKYKKEDARNRIKDLTAKSKRVKSLISTAVYRPSLPDDRSHDHFNIDDKVMVWAKGFGWTPGVVVSGYRHHDGCVSYIMEGVGPQSHDEGGFWGCGMSVPTVLKKKDWDFFRNNPDSYKVWTDVAYAKKFNGEKIPVRPIP